MRRANRKDKSLVVDIIVQTFLDNQGVNWMFSNRGNREWKLTRLAEYAFIKCLHRDGVFISSNGKGAALFYRGDKRAFSLLELFYEVRFGLLSIPFRNILEVTRREAHRKSKRPQDKPYYYFWFLGVLKEGASAGFELNRELMNLAARENIPIYLETTTERNQTIYEKMGYENYDHWEDRSKDIRFWFMKWQGKRA